MPSPMLEAVCARLRTRQRSRPKCFAHSRPLEAGRAVSLPDRLEISHSCWSLRSGLSTSALRQNKKLLLRRAGRTPSGPIAPAYIPDDRAVIPPLIWCGAHFQRNREHIQRFTFRLAAGKIVANRCLRFALPFVPPDPIMPASLPDWHD
jgi:hypothetical protein